MWTLYRHYDENGRLLYVGTAANPSVRLSQHRTASLWWGAVASSTYARYESATLCAQAEVDAIHSESPLWNQSHSMRMSMVRDEVTAATPYVHKLYELWPSGAVMLSAYEIQRITGVRSHGRVADRAVAAAMAECGIRTRASGGRRGYWLSDVVASIKA